MVQLRLRPSHAYLEAHGIPVVDDAIAQHLFHLLETSLFLLKHLISFKALPKSVLHLPEVDAVAKTLMYVEALPPNFIDCKLHLVFHIFLTCGERSPPCRLKDVVNEAYRHVLVVAAQHGEELSGDFGNGRVGALYKDDEVCPLSDGVINGIVDVGLSPIEARHVDDEDILLHEQASRCGD